MIEVLLGWVSTLKTALLYIALYTLVIIVIRAVSLYYYFKTWDDDDNPPGPYYTP